MGLTDILYPEQKKILDSWNQVKSVGYRDEEIAFETLLFSVFKGIQRHEKSIFIIPDKQKRYRFYKYLQDCGLSPLSLEFDTYASVTKEDVKNLQQKISFRHSDHILCDADLTTRNMLATKDKIRDILHAFHNPDGDRTFQSVLDRLRFVRTFKNQNLVTAVSFEWFSEMDEKTFDSVYDIIVRASMLYNPRFYHGRNYRAYNINEKYISSEDKLQEFLLKMARFIEEIDVLRDAYYQFILDTRHENMDALNKKFLSIQKDLDEVTAILHSLTFTLQEHEHSSVFKFFGIQNSQTDKTTEPCKLKYRELEKKLRELPEFRLPESWPSEPLKDREKTLSVLGALKDQLMLWYKAEKEKVYSFQKYSNIYNQKEKERLASLEARFFNLTQAINAEHLIDKKFEINTISLQKQTELINSMLLECTYLYADVSDNHGYYLWDAFLQEQSGKVREILEWFKNFPVEEWPNIFEYIYLQKWLEEKTNVYSSELATLLSQYKEEIKRTTKVTGSYLCHLEMADRAEIIKNLQGQDKSLYKNIQAEKGLEKLNWRYFFENNGSFWGSLFHVVLTSGDQFEDLKPGVFTNLFYLDDAEINPEVLHLGTTIHSYFLSTEPEMMGYDLLLEAEKIELKMAGGKATVERLQSARALAKTFVSVQDNFAIFQTKKANIISCLHPVLNSHLLSHFRELGIKELYIENQHVERLVECLIETSRKSLLLTHDFVINPQETGNLASQLQIAADFEKMSYNIYNIESVRLAGHFNEALHQFFEALPLRQ